MNPNRNAAAGSDRASDVCDAPISAYDRDDERHGKQSYRRQPERQTSGLVLAAIFFLSASQTLRTSAVISEQSSICWK